ncbi:MAG TPA: PAS domain S-box protein, partial [Longimicrobium sp.]|nr:PAS domain S-box protein [Longimicrobium sp.]
MQSAAPDAAFDIDHGPECGAARIRALADAASGAAGADSPRALAAVLRRAVRAALPCDAFRFATHDNAEALHYHDAAPAPGLDALGLRAVCEHCSLMDHPGGGEAGAVLAAPVLHGGEALGVLVAWRAADRGYTPVERQVLEALAAVAAAALVRLRLTAGLERANQALEQRVEARTQELARANDALAAEVALHSAARDELLRRTQELEVVFQALPDLYFRMRDDGLILGYRAGAESALYVPPEDFIHRRVQDVLPPQVGEQFDAACGEVRRTGQLASIEYELHLPNAAAPRAFEARIVPLVPGELATVVREITGRKQAEEALRASEESYRGLFDNLTELVYIQDLEGRFLNVNEAVVRAYGYTREELLGQTPDMLADPARVDLEQVMECFRRAVEGEPQRFEWWARRKDGTFFPKEVSVARSTYFGRDVMIA